MKLNEFNPSYDDLITLSDRVLFGHGDIWKVDQDGVPHRHINPSGELVTVKVPEFFPMKDKGRKLRRMTIWCNACELVTGVEAHYGDHVVVYAAQMDGTLYKTATAKA